MDIKDSYLHGTVGVVKSISVSADKLKYKLADIAGTVREVTLPVATTSANGLMSSADKSKLDAFNSGSLKNDLVLKINSGTTEGTSLYTYNGSAAKTLDIKSGTGIGFTNNAGSLQIYNSGVRSVATGTTNGTISVNTGGAVGDVAVKGLGSAAYTASTDYYNLKTYVSPASDSWYYKKITVTKNNTYGYGIWLHSRQQHFLANSGLALGTSYMLKLYELGTNINGTDTSRSMSVKMVATYSSSDVTFYVKINGYNYLQVVSSGTITILDSTQSEYDGITPSTEGWIPCTYAKWTDTTYTFTSGTAGNFTVTPLGGTAQTVSIGKPATASTADAADKLKTKRKLWGRDFDGSSNITGSIYVGNTYVGNNQVIYGTDAEGNTYPILYPLLSDGVTYLDYGPTAFHLRNKSSETVLYATSGRNIGICTANPTAKLDVVGSLKCNHFFDIRDNSDVKKRLTLQVSGGVGRIYTYNETDSSYLALIIGRNDNKALNISSAGNVGINKDPSTEKLDVNGNVKATSFIGNLDGTYVNKLTGYAKATAAADLAATDTLNSALGKLEYKADTAYDWVISVTATDTDTYVNKWLEIVDFLDSVTEGTDITDEFVTRKTAQTITGKKTFTSDLILSVEAANTDSPKLIFERNGSNNSYYDWLLYVTAGHLIFTSNSSGTHAERIKFVDSGGILINSKEVLHAGNYTSYLPFLNSSSTHATDASVIYAPVTAGTKGQVLTSNGSGAPVWSALSNIIAGSLKPTVILASGSSAFKYVKFASINLTLRYAGKYAVLKLAQYLTTSTNYANSCDVHVHCYQLDEMGIAPEYTIQTNNDNNYFEIIGIVNYSATNSTLDLYVYGKGSTYKSINVTTIIGDNIISVGSNINSLPAGTIVIPTKMGHVAAANNGIFYIEGTGSTAGTWLGSHTGITSYYVGLTIAYKIPIAGASTTTLNINSLGAITCYINTSKLTTHYGVGSVAILVYDGTYFRAADYWDGNSYAYVRQYTTDSTNSEYPLLFRYNTAAPTSNGYVTEYTRYDSGITINPSTNTITATTFTGNLSGNATTATTANVLKATTVVSAKAFSLSNASWNDTGYTFASLTSGTYVVQVTSGSNLVASGIMSVYKNLSDTAGDEIPLHVYGTAGWRPYLRTYANKLLISSNDASATSRTVTIKIALIL